MSSFAHEDRQGSIDFISDQDIKLESDRNQDGSGDIVFRTGGVERARIKADGTGTGWPNVLGGSRSYVAAPTGVSATDTAAIQTALNAASSAGGGIVNLAGGTYVTGTLTVASNVHLLGAGRGVTILDIQTDHTATGRYLGIGALGGAVATKASVRDVTIICSNASARNQAYGMVSVWGGSDIVLDLEVLSGEGCGIWTGTPGVTTTTGVHRLWLLRPRVTGTLADGIHLSRGAQDCWLIAPEVDSTGDDGIALNSIQTDDGTHMYDQISRVRIVAPTVRDITSVVGSGLSLNGCKNCEVLGGSAYTINNPGANSFGANVSSSGGGNGAATYTATGNRLNGFRADSCKNGILVGTATDTDLTGCEGCNNVGTGAYGLGMIGSTNTHVVGGKYTGNGGGGSGVGVYGTSSNVDCYVANADLRGNTTSASQVDSGVTVSTSCITTTAAATGPTSPPVLVPMRAATGANAVWGSANRAVFARVSIPGIRSYRYFHLSIGVQSGNIQVGLVRLTGLSYVRVMDSTVIACPAAANDVKIDLGSTSLAPGDYALFVWADNTTVTISVGSSSQNVKEVVTAQVDSLSSGVPSSGSIAAWGSQVIPDVVLADA